MRHFSNLFLHDFLSLEGAKGDSHSSQVFKEEHFVHLSIEHFSQDFLVKSKK